MGSHAPQDAALQPDPIESQVQTLLLNLQPQESGCLALSLLWPQHLSPTCQTGNFDGQLGMASKPPLRHRPWNGLLHVELSNCSSKCPRTRFPLIIPRIAFPFEVLRTGGHRPPALKKQTRGHGAERVTERVLQSPPPASWSLQLWPALEAGDTAPGFCGSA